MRGLGLLLLRVVVGAVFITHGLPKLIPLWGGSPGTAAAVFEAIGVSPAHALSVATGIVEVLAGALLVAGAYTVWTTGLLVATTFATSWKLNVSQECFPNWALEPGVWHRVEFDVVLMSALVCLLLAGPGWLSIDARRTRASKAERLHGKI